MAHTKSVELTRNLAKCADSENSRMKDIGDLHDFELGHLDSTHGYSRAQTHIPILT